MWFWLKQWIRLRYPSALCIRSDDLQRTLAIQRPGDWLIPDVRTAAEFNVSCLPGAVQQADGGEIPALGPLGEASLEHPIVVCCSVGLRSAAVVDQLRQRGFRRAVNLEGGLFEWVNQGHQLVHGGRPTMRVHPAHPQSRPLISTGRPNPEWCWRWMAAASTPPGRSPSRRGELHPAAHLPAAPGTAGPRGAPHTRRCTSWTRTCSARGAGSAMA
ncbi:rhodanese-like domain-containing protein [Synechococcus sp. 1G10]|uniref:rhodanese-like domain-containing protein n=1 Tax=Synechococcus sp. 1G10 TaxID=2025605 RepID=UPI0035125D90